MEKKINLTVFSSLQDFVKNTGSHYYLPFSSQIQKKKNPRYNHYITQKMVSSKVIVV